jgi:hypothetical protein
MYTYNSSIWFALFYKYILTSNLIKLTGFVEIPPTDTGDASSPSTSGSAGWSEKAEKCLLDHFAELSKIPVKNRWLKIAQKMKDTGHSFTSEQCRLKIKSLKERHARVSKKRKTSGEGGFEDVLEDKMTETFSTPDYKPVYISESGR